MHHITRHLLPSRFKIRGRLALVAAALASVVGMALGGTAVADVIFGGSPPVAGKHRFYQTMTAKHSGLNLNVPDASTKNGSPIIQWSDTTVNGDSKSMNGQWEFLWRQGMGNGVSIRNRWSRQCLDVDSVNPGPVLQRPCDGTVSQEWIVNNAQQSGDPIYRNYRNAWSGLDLNISGGSTELGGQLIQWPHVQGAPNALFKTKVWDVVD
jgi:hypothetical protein